MRLKRKAETGMQYVLKQTLLRRNQLLRRARRTQHKEFKDELHKMKQSQLLADRWTRRAVKDERKNRREDWLCGPLAPKRDIGESRDVYGTAGQEIIQAPELPKKQQLKDEEIGIVAGDRVVVVRGIGRGRIGEVADVKTDSQTCIIKGIRQADFPIPTWSPAAENAKEKHTAGDLPIPLKDVRLVYPLIDHETGYKRDVIVRHMHFDEPHIERNAFSNLPSHTRYLSLSADEHVVLEWPEEQLAEHSATDADTKRLVVEERTYHPVPVRGDMVPNTSVITELRDPYARDRSSHDLDFMKKKVLIDMKRAWERERQKRGGVAIGTPKSEFWAMEMEKRAVEREKREREGPDPETLRILQEEMRSMRVTA